MTSPPRAIELFCGCGGLSTGVLDAGIPVLAGYDHDRPSIESFNYNHVYRGSAGHVVDLALASSEDLRSVGNLPESIDLVVGGPPCQPFSIAGKQQGLNDKRGDLIFKFTSFIRDLRPTAFLFENVPNLTRMNDGLLVEAIQAELATFGYEVKYAIVNAADYGVPQARRRFLMVGVPKGVSFSFPEATHGESIDIFEMLKPYVTVAEAIGDLPDVDEPRARTIPNHEPTMHSEKMINAFQQLRPGTRDRKSFHDRLHGDRLGYTLRAGSGNFSPLRPVHYKYDRVITVRESARLQGMTDDFIWPDPLPRLQQYRQVGNAVPPPLAAAIAEQLASVLGWQVDPEATRGDLSARPPAFFLSYEERHQSRLQRLRGASLGQ